ncbi:MAG: hypothetical protein FWH57_11140 [Oscillospiraceae bacterium]|nr:hypothetical protein [Oscillospiraceae bacterium]
MLPAKIRLTDQMLDYIRAARIAKRIPAATLSRAIKRDDSYISSLELKRLRTISSVDLVAILCFLFNISEHEALERAEELIGVEKKAAVDAIRSPQYSPSNIDSNEIQKVSETSREYRWYDTRINYAEPELINDMLEVLVGLITEFYRNDPKEAVYVLNSFIKTMKFDPIFTMSVMGIPFFMLKNLNIDERKEVLDDLSAVFREHAATANQKTNSFFSETSTGVQNE